MADPLMVFSLQPPPFLIFSSCSLHRRWCLSRIGIRFSVQGFRLSSQLQLSNSTSPSQSSSSSSTALEKLDLVSTTQLKDGSHVFRFGDASEVERNRESEEKARCLEVEKTQQKQHAEIKGVKDGHALADLDRVSELESPKEKSVVKKKPVKYNTETVSEKEEKDAPASLSSVIKIKDRKRVRSPVKKKKETPSTVNVLGSEEDEAGAKVASVNSIVSVAEAIPTTSTEEKTNENVEPLSSEVSVNEIRRDCETNGYQQLTESRVEEQAGPISSTSQRDSQLNEVKEVMKVSTIELDDRLEEREDLMKTFEAEENLVGEPTATVEVDVSPDELVVVSPESRVEVQARPGLSTSQHGSRLDGLKEVMKVSTIELNENLDEMEDLMKSFKAEENLVVEPTAIVELDASPDELVVVSPEESLVVEPTATVAVSPDELVVVSPEESLVVEPTATVGVSPDELVGVSPDELISTSEATNHRAEEIAETPAIDTSEVANDEENVASTIEDEVSVIDSKNDNGSITKTASDTNDEDLQLPAPIEVASDREELVSKAFYLESGSASLQNPNKALAGREDAYFISNNNWLGVADGVSQWSFEGISEGMFAQELMSNCEKIISDETAEICDPVQVLHRSVDETKSSGSSTALIAHLDNNELHVANIGDSGFMVIRNRKVLQKSSPMFHHFCFPLHITQGDDVLKLAEVYHVNLEEGDVVITATDGLFDNLYKKEIVSIVCRLLEQGVEPQRIAELLAAKAQEVGTSETERTPFADAAKEEGHDGYRGGKLDAVTVIVSLVKTVAGSPDEIVVVSPEENLVVESTATVAASPKELVAVSPEENLVVEPTTTVSVSPDEPVAVSPEENLVETTAIVAVSPDGLISTSEATTHSVEEIAETPVIDTSEVANDGENMASAIEDEVAVIDSKNDNGSISKTVNDANDENLQLPEPETADLQPIEVVSDREEIVPKAFYLESGSASLQNSNKALAGRQDAYFVSDNNNWLGVADGVSQWSFEGISEGMYAQEIMSNCERIVSDETAEICDPVQVLHRSVNETKSSGSSTALIAHLDNNELHVANIGDSGFMVVRNRKVLQKSSPMFHHFCFPLHITQDDDVLNLAEVYHMKLEEGDVVITATDGLFDNLYEKEIIAIVCRLLEQGVEPQRIAELLAAKAQEVGRSKTERTPFADAAKEEGHDSYRGGKLDAVTVIVSLVKTVSS